MAKVIAVTNQKGGVGKTATCSALCGGLAQMEYRVLAVDLDPQGNLSFSLGAEAEDNYTIYDVFKSNCDITEAVQKCAVCDVIPSNILLSGTELELTGVGREYILREQLELIRNDYDYIILDTPPALSVLTINAYTASDELVIPMLCEILSLQGIAQLKQTIFAVQRYYNKDLKVKGILLNKYNPRYMLTQEVEDLAQMIAKQLDTKIFESKISASICIAEAPAHGVSVMTYSPKSKAVKEYADFIGELIGVKPKIACESENEEQKEPENPEETEEIIENPEPEKENGEKPEEAKESEKTEETKESEKTEEPKETEKTEKPEETKLSGKNTKNKKRRERRSGRNRNK